MSFMKSDDEYDFIKNEQEQFFPMEVQDYYMPNSNSIPTQLEEDVNPNKRRKFNDQFQLLRYSLTETNEQRKDRLERKRNIRKEKIDKLRKLVELPKDEKSTTTYDCVSSQELPLTKEELRRMKNRNSAQQSRDRKKMHQNLLAEENQKLSEELDITRQEIKCLLTENDKLAYKLKALTDMRNRTFECPICKNHISQPNIVQAQNTSSNKIELSFQPNFKRIQTYSSRQLKTYGLLSLFLVVTIFGCLNTVTNQEGTPVSLYQVRQKNKENQLIDEQKLAEKYFTNQDDVEIKDLNYDVIKDEPFLTRENLLEITTLDQMRNIQHISLSETDQDATYNFNIHLNIDESENQKRQDLIGSKIRKTLFFNCTVAQDKCKSLSRFIEAQSLSEVHSIQPMEKDNQSSKKKEPQSIRNDLDTDSNFKQYEHGQEITILQVFKGKNKYILNSVKCVVDKISNLAYDISLIEQFDF